ncbi:MAG: hypothetical protein Q9201_006277 [Fulgogasparrea decipioides]
MRRHQNGVQGQSYGRQLAEIHANAIPGATRDEEGEEMLSTNNMDQSPAQRALHMNYKDMERSRERERYEEYLDEQDSEKLPNAFDLGWKTNLQNLFGEKPLFWFLPFCNSLGDGWHWEPSQKWLEAREDIKCQRESQWNEQHEGRTQYDSAYSSENLGTYDQEPRNPANIRDASPNGYLDGHRDNDSASSKMSLKTLRRRESFEEDYKSDQADDYDVSSDEQEDRISKHRGAWYQSTEPTGHTDEENSRKKWA